VEKGVQGGDGVGVQLDAACGAVDAGPFGVAGTRDGVRSPVEDPRERELRGLETLGVGELA
jgi:hypothetical protein